MNEKEYNHFYYLANRERLLPKHNEWNRAHQEETSAKLKAKREAEKALRPPKPRLSEEEKTERQKAYGKKYRQSHREQESARAKKYYAEHREVCIARSRERYKKMKEEAAGIEKRDISP